MGSKNSRGQNDFSKCGPLVASPLSNQRYQVVPGQKCQSSCSKRKSSKQKNKCPQPLQPPCLYFPPPPPFMYYMNMQCQQPKPKQCCALVHQCRTCCY